MKVLTSMDRTGLTAPLSLSLSLARSLPPSVYRKFGWTTANKDLFMIGNEKDIMIGGGGGCGIWLDRYHLIVLRTL